MKREFSPVYLALFLVLGCVAFRLLSSLFPNFIPNISPLMAIAFVGAMYLPARWGWLIGSATLLITDIAFMPTNAQIGGSMFSWWTAISLVVYALAGGLGILVASHRAWLRIIGGSILCSTLFYVVANTFAWLGSLAPANSPGYPASFAGWLQANTVGLPGWVPTWTFLRNGMAGDLFFVVVLILILDRVLLFRPSSERMSTLAA